MISLFVSNSDPKNTSNNGSQVTLALNPAVMLNPEKKYYASAVEVDIVFCFANIFTGVNDKFVYKEMKGGILTTFTHHFSQGLYSVSAIRVRHFFTFFRAEIFYVFFTFFFTFFTFFYVLLRKK